MTHLLNLLAAIALLVWGTHLVRKDTLRVMGANLRKVLAQSVNHRLNAVVSDNTLKSIETSSLHLDLISDFKRINSHISSIAYPILDSAGALEPSRLRHKALDAHTSRTGKQHAASKHL